MTKFGKTILGKILKGAAKVILPVGAALTGIGAVTGMAKGVGALAGVGLAVSKGKAVIGKVGASAVNLITGTTKAEREQLQAQKNKTKAAQDKLDQVDRLMKAGATAAEARAAVGLSAEEVPVINNEVTTASLFDSPFVKYGAIAAGAFFLAKALKIIK